MAPIIASGGQTRSRLPAKWMQSAPTKATAALTITKSVDGHVSPQESPLRWSTHTLAADPHDTLRSRADSTTSTYVDTFAHRRKNRVSDLTFVDHFDQAALPSFPRLESDGFDLNDASLTLNNDDDSFDLNHPASYEQDALKTHDDSSTRHNGNMKAHFQFSDAHHDDPYFDDDDDEMAQRINRLMAATMEALEASNRLVLDTLSSRAKLAQLNAVEAALDSHLDAREAHLHRQIQAVNDMTDFISKTSAELQRLIGTGPSHGLRIPSGVASTSHLSTLADAAELQGRVPPLLGSFRRSIETLPSARQQPSDSSACSRLLRPPHHHRLQPLRTAGAAATAAAEVRADALFRSPTSPLFSPASRKKLLPIWTALLSRCTWEQANQADQANHQPRLRMPPRHHPTTTYPHLRRSAPSATTAALQAL